MFRIERSNGRGGWDTMMACPHRIGIDMLREPPGDAWNQYPPAITPGNKTAFSGRPGSQARVRYKDEVIELYDWEHIPVNEFDGLEDDPDRPMIWGWKLIAQNHISVPVQELSPWGAL